MALIRAARAGDRTLGRVVQPAPPSQLHRRCATSRVRVDLLSGAHGVRSGVKTKRGSLQETQGDSEIPNTGAFQFTRGGSPVDRTRTIQGSCSATRDHPARRGGYRQRRNDVPVLRHLSAHLLQVATPLPGAWTRGPARALASATGLPTCHQGRGGGQDPPPPPALPLWPGQDRHVSQAISRRRGEPFRDLADPEASQAEPSAGVAALQTSHPTLEAL